MNYKILGLIGILALIMACAPTEPISNDELIKPTPEPTPEPTPVVNVTNTTFEPMDNESVYVNIDDINNMTSNNTVVEGIVGNETRLFNLSNTTGGI